MSSRPPPQGPPPSYAFVSRVYSRNLRPVVIAIAAITAIWSLFSAIGYFRSIGIDRKQGFSKLAVWEIVLGAMYSALLAFGIFGVLAAMTQRLPLVRIYAFLTAASALIVVAASLLRVIIHFTMKNDIINECATLTQGQTVVAYPFGIFGPSFHDILGPQDALDWCTGAWDHDSWADIVSLIIYIILAALFTVISFSYYRQVLDPSSAANFSRVQPNRTGAPSHYNPPYDATVPNLGYGYNMPYAGGPPPSQQGYQAYPAYAPPPGPPPEGIKAPDYLSNRGAEKADDPFADFEDGPSRREGGT